MPNVIRNTYKVIGEMDFDAADDANIPVNIFLGPMDGEPGVWRLTADNFMPRKMACSEGPYEFTSKDRKVLVNMVKKYWRPLYVVALELLELKPDKEGKACLYYWEAEKK